MALNVMVRCTMPTVEVCWGLKQRSLFEWQPELNVVEFVEMIQDQIQAHLEASSSWGFETVEYGLFRLVGASLQQLERRMPLRSLQLQPGEQFYFANVLNPWWSVTELYCEVEVLPGAPRISVPTDGLVLGRSSILKQLPKHIADRERRIYREKRDSPLSRVSRDRHCAILFDNGWRLHCHNIVSIDGAKWHKSTIYPLDHEGSRTIILGSEGWPVTIYISRRQQQRLPLHEL
jgi:hypothetical protein